MSADQASTHFQLRKIETESDASFMKQGSKPPPKRSFTKSSVADSHARVMAELKDHAPDAPKEIENWQTYLIAASLCMGAVAYGYDTGFFGGTLALQSFKDAFGTAKNDTINANLVSLFQGGSFFGALLQLPMTEHRLFGRKWSIVVSNIIFIASAFMQTFANGSIGLMMGGRFLGGLAIGISSLVVPVYLAEFAPPRIRGRLIGMYDMGIQTGTLAGFWINYGISATLPYGKFQWQFPMAVQLFPAALLGVAMFFIPETPRFLTSIGKYEQAEKNLCRIRHLPAEHEYLQWELTEIRAQAESEALVRAGDSYWTLLKQLFQSKGHRNRLALGLGLLFFKTFSGVQAVNYYSPRIFEQLGLKGTKNSLFATGIYGTVKFVSTIIFSFFIVDRIGRRRPLMFNSIFGSLCLFFIGAWLTGKGPRGENPVRVAGDYVAITAIFLYASLYCFGYNSVPLTLISEIFTMRLRALSMTICMAWQWLCTFSIVRIMPVALKTITTKTYFIFGSIFISSTIFVYFLIPETKGLPLEAMDSLFGGVERTDAEAAVMGINELSKTKNEGTTQHVEHAGPMEGTDAGAIARAQTLDLIAASLCMGAVACGYDTGFFGGTLALQSFKDAFGTAKNDTINANFVSLL